MPPAPIAMANPHPPCLLSPGQARDYQARRLDEVLANPAVPVWQIEQADAQMTWWMIWEIFDRHPDLGSFEIGDGDKDDDPEGSAGLLVKLQVQVFGLEPGTRPVRAEEAARALLDVIRGYGLVEPEGFFDLVATGGCTRAQLGTWDWGAFGQGWQAARQAALLDRALPSATSAAPSPRL